MASKADSVTGGFFSSLRFTLYLAAAHTTTAVAVTLGLKQVLVAELLGCQTEEQQFNRPIGQMRFLKDLAVTVQLRYAQLNDFNMR